MKTATESVAEIIMHYENQRARVAGLCLQIQQRDAALAADLRTAIEWRECAETGCVLESGHSSPHLIAM